MSIDLEIIKWRSTRNFNFPLALDDMIKDASGNFASVPWRELRQILKETGGEAYLNEDSLVLSFRYDGILSISSVQEPSENSDDYMTINFNVQTYWTHVLDIYRKALELDPDLLLLDPQEDILHNVYTFEPIAKAQKECQRKSEKDYMG
jgi:hypothetical protein